MLVNLAGMIGCGLLVSLYLCMLTKRMKPGTYKFMFGNLLGAFLLLVNGVLSNAYFVYPVINGVWFMGTLVQIIKKWGDGIAFKKLLDELKYLDCWSN